MIGTSPYLIIRKTLSMSYTIVQKLGVKILQLITVFKLAYSFLIVQRIIKMGLI